MLVGELQNCDVLEMKRASVDTSMHPKFRAAFSVTNCCPLIRGKHQYVLGMMPLLVHHGEMFLALFLLFDVHCALLCVLLLLTAYPRFFHL